MGGQVELRCRCGSVRAVVAGVSPQTVNRVVCYCDDCQAFLHQLGRADLLNAKGGSDIVQVAPSTLAFVQGQDRIAGIRLSPKGLYRWYASCCNAPIGNTLTPTIPFVGIIAQAFAGGASAVDEVAGAPVGAILGKYAVGEPPPGSTGLNLPLILRAIGKVLSWKVRGKTWPHPFFKREAQQPIYPITVLSREQRDALRPLCGPRPNEQTVP
ncbi:DUF6151 family protein [uncultured Bradyrhizobium sp.]|uniref:DUF6151 family protein n=1 Tax=uncultured Bradyrhizobium sp. TaxID=199684 RepID=UPI0026072A3C|nr:DUF6151 family protein [uncultured Bradyrhizobium sp.]